MKTTETMKHTPGPWTDGGHDGKQSIVIETQWGSVAKALPIGCVMQEKANARLIAAAPDLKNALEIALATIERLAPSHRGFDSTRGTKDVVMAALAKAEGRT